MEIETTCPECGSTPIGVGCYHICPNSIHYYSPEQERYDNYYVDRYEGWGDPELYPDDRGEDDDPDIGVTADLPVVPPVLPSAVAYADDLPF